MTPLRQVLRTFARRALPAVVDSLAAVALAWTGFPVPLDPYWTGEPVVDSLEGPPPGHPERVRPDAAMTIVERALWHQLSRSPSKL